MSDELFAEQLAYYNARAQEYDESVQQTGRYTGPGIPEVDTEWQYLARRLHALPPVEHTLELACGTGLWTQELLDVSERITAVDGAPEMLAANQAKLNSPRVTYQQADLFVWQPQDTYDQVFFAFWISHVPPERLAAFLQQAAAAVKPGGRIFIADEPAGGKQLSGPVENDIEQTRTLHNGETFRIVKVYHDTQALQRQLEALGFTDIDLWVGDFFFSLTATKSVT
ncbi:MAG: class I SAM-dependent methyltransferase [Anaerolineales bacterium]|nr:class I SAM-dependent methyltransferase [Anaerolineales bacterium]